jgi:hypothetical protein
MIPARSNRCQQIVASLSPHGIASLTSRSARSYTWAWRALTSSKGDSANARVACNDFFALRKDPDPSVSLLKQAKAEYARLQ